MRAVSCGLGGLGKVSGGFVSWTNAWLGWEFTWLFHLTLGDGTVKRSFNPTVLLIWFR